VVLAWSWLEVLGSWGGRGSFSWVPFVMGGREGSFFEIEKITRERRKGSIQGRG